MAFNSFSEFCFFWFRAIFEARFATLLHSFDVIFINTRLVTSEDVCRAFSYIVKHLFFDSALTRFITKTCWVLSKPYSIKSFICATSKTSSRNPLPIVVIPLQCRTLHSQRRCYIVSSFSTSWPFLQQSLYGVLSLLTCLPIRKWPVSSPINVFMSILLNFNSKRPICHSFQVYLLYL